MNDSIVLKNISQKVKQLREQAKFSQEELAMEIGVSQGTLCNLESGRQKSIDLILFLKICKHFKIQPGTFIEDIVIPPPTNKLIFWQT